MQIRILILILLNTHWQAISFNAKNVLTEGLVLIVKKIDILKN
jgi:hypothetical protein